MPGPYSIAKLQQLAADEDFVLSVRELAGALYGAHAVRDSRNLAPLLHYGSQAHGVALRLMSIPRFADIDACPELAGEWARLAAQLEAVAGTPISPSSPL